MTMELRKLLKEIEDTSKWELFPNSSVSRRHVVTMQVLPEPNQIQHSPYPNPIVFFAEIKKHILNLKGPREPKQS